MISERRKQEELTTRFGRILDNSSNEIYVFDASTLHFVQVNSGARKNLGYSMDELTHLTPLELKPEHTLETFEKLIEPLRSGKKSMIVFETVHKRKDGMLYPVEVKLQLMHEETPPVFIAIIQDATMRKQAEEKLD
ncbi:MAG: PAS domain S-box protein [Nitrospina sp.]|nr:PAS domain S-box protein [Nitrospina sp.]